MAEIMTIYILLVVVFVETAAIVVLAFRPTFRIILKASGMNSSVVDVSSDESQMNCHNKELLERAMRIGE